MEKYSNLLLCYNRGCGQKYDPNDNGPEACRHHVGVPVFHDAYKGWSCCKKKCTDFTEFLNIKGCTVSSHSNVKPPEPEKSKEEKGGSLVIEYKEPTRPIVRLARPSFDSPLTVLKVEVSAPLQKELDNLARTTTQETSQYDGTGAVPIGTICCNNNCNAAYEGPESLTGTCVHHPGYPVFHEGLKFWSCCTKRTTDFNAFLQQVGCTTSTHVWFKIKGEDGGGGGEAKCRLDWHQTSSEVVVSLYGKRPDPTQSSVELSPVRLRLTLYYPDQRAFCKRDIHLTGVVDVEQSSVRMGVSKVEVKLKKAEVGGWQRLELPSTTEEPNLTRVKPSPPQELTDIATENTA